MSTIKQLLRLHLQGLSNRKIAEQIGLYKGTVNRYVQKL
ncbi:winged helix-turn-helix domain-containing protein [Sphingobacterium multivorum]|nr:winged helix-turn-helix domain-containing protein [Sphingobacterium multivorum]QRQ61283.1 winged helix-turn-helix domain-containing protein [Sphingobacterium multivorum]